MSSTTILNESAQVVLDGSGNGAVLLGPQYAAQIWHVTMIAVQVTTNVKEPVFKAYDGKSVGNLNFIDGTYTGSNDSSNIPERTVYHGSGIYGVWTGGDPGATAAMILTGTMEIP